MSGIHESRRTAFRVFYNSVDITVEITKNILSVVYTDNESDKSDDLQISVEDRDGLWHGAWFPQKGAVLSLEIIQDNHGDKRQVCCGDFEIDSIDFQGPPDVVTIKSASLPCTANIRLEEKSKAWENIRLSAIAADIAGENSLSPMFECDDDPYYDRADQNQESDIVFLKRLADKEGCSVKVSAGMLIIFDELKYESKEPVKTISKGKSGIINYSMYTTMSDTDYSACEVSYTDPKTKKTISYTYTPRNSDKSAPVLKINERVNNREEARKLAMKRLREKNKNETTASFTLVGDVDYAAGTTVILDGFRAFDGKYIVQKVSHNIGGGYTANIELRKVLEGY